MFLMKIGDISEDELFRHKAQRWLWNEQAQLTRRYREFDLGALAKVLENVTGARARCVDISKLPEGNFNKTLLVRMHDGHQLVARLPNPNAGPPRFTTASEVATMAYVRRSFQVDTI